MILIYTLLYFLVGFGVLALFYAYAEYKVGHIYWWLADARARIVIFWPIVLIITAFLKVDSKLQEVVIKFIRKIKYG